MNEKKRWRTKIKNAKECRIELSFPDLQIKFSNGYSLPLKVSEGEEILMDLLDSEDIKKSWLVGSLKGYLANGWIEPVPENPTIKEPSTPISQFITEQMVLAPKIEPIKNEPKQEVPLPQDVKPNLKEANEILNKPIEVVQPIEIINDLSKVTSYEEFNKLSQILKLRFIKDCQNIDLLKSIASSTQSTQIRNNIQLRLSQIKI